MSLVPLEFVVAGGTARYFRPLNLWVYRRRIEAPRHNVVTFILTGYLAAVSASSIFVAVSHVEILANCFQACILQNQSLPTRLIKLHDGAGVLAGVSYFGDSADAEGGVADHLALTEFARWRGVEIVLGGLGGAPAAGGLAAAVFDFHGVGGEFG
jgi:hypothetical protein